MRTVFDRWWAKNSDLADRQNTMRDVAKAAFYAGRAYSLKEADQDKKDAQAEAMWQERQGEEYGSY